VSSRACTKILRRYTKSKSKSESAAYYAGPTSGDGSSYVVEHPIKATLELVSGRLLPDSREHGIGIRPLYSLRTSSCAPLYCTASGFVALWADISRSAASSFAGTDE
jgi:hypothetical protein